MMNSTEIDLYPGAVVTHKGRRCRIKLELDLRQVLLEPLDDPGEPFRADICDLRPGVETRADEQKRAEDVASFAGEPLAIAQARMAIILPLLKGGPRSLAEIAKEHNVDCSTIYRWLATYRKKRRLSALIPRYAERGHPGDRRLNADTEAEIETTIKDVYMTAERPSISKTAKTAADACKAKGYPIPSLTAVRARILAKDPRRLAEARDGANAAMKLDSSGKSLPGAEHPWAIVMMDHTPLDLAIVSRDTRLPIGRVYVTIAACAYTRICLGIYLSLDPPSANSVGMCLARAMLPKEQWLAHLGIPGDLPVWGKPEVLLVDNAKEFRSKMLRRACEEFGITLQHRRVRKPKDGQRVERMFLTIAHEVHTLPGTTFSNSEDRGEYDSEKNAVMTLDELERYLVDWIVNIYHQTPHAGLNGRRPIDVWNDESLRFSRETGLGLPPRPVDEHAIRLSLLPMELRTVQWYGVSWDGIQYWSEDIRRWIDAREPDSRKRRRKFIVRRDPDRIDRIYFYDPKLKKHVEAPYRDATRPPISLWELRVVQRHLHAQNKKRVDEAALFAARERLRASVVQATEETKRTRREREQEERRREQAERRAKGKPTPPPKARQLDNQKPEGQVDYEPFDDVEN